MKEHLDEMKKVLAQKEEVKVIDLEIENLKAEISKLEMDLQLLMTGSRVKPIKQKRIDNKIAELNEKEATRESINNEIKAMTANLKTLALENLQQQMDEYKDEAEKVETINNLEREIRVRDFESEKATKIADLEREIRVRDFEKQKAEKIHSLEKKIQNRKQSIPKSNEVIKDAEAASEYLETEIEEGTKRLINNPSQNKMYAKQIAKNAKNLERNRAIIQDKRRQIQEQELQIAQFEKQLEEAKGLESAEDHVQTYSYLEYDELVRQLEDVKSQMPMEEPVEEYADLKESELKAQLDEVSNWKVLEEHIAEYVELENKFVRTRDGFNIETEVAKIEEELSVEETAKKVTWDMPNRFWNAIPREEQEQIIAEAAEMLTQEDFDEIVIIKHESKDDVINKKKAVKENEKISNILKELETKHNVLIMGASFVDALYKKISEREQPEEDDYYYDEDNMELDEKADLEKAISRVEEELDEGELGKEELDEEELDEEGTEGRAIDTKTGKYIETEEIPPEEVNEAPVASVATKESMVEKVVDGIAKIPSVIASSKLGKMVVSMFKVAWGGLKKVANKLLNVLKIKDDINEYNGCDAEEKAGFMEKFSNWMDNVMDTLFLEEEEYEEEYEEPQDEMAKYNVDNSGNKVEEEAKKNMSGKTERADEKNQRTHTD